jgi:hypothetical protein
MPTYSVIQLSKIFNVSRNTIYAKLNSDELKEYVEQAEQGLRLNQKGFNMLKIALSNSKNVTQMIRSSTADKKEKFEHADNKIIEILESQIAELKQEKEDLKKEITEYRTKYDNIVNMFIEQQNNQKLLQERNTSIWDMFKRNHK